MNDLGLLQEPFMRRALLSALLLGPLCALMGVFVTARRFAFFSDTISHASLAGIAIGFWLGMAEPTWPMLGFVFLVALAMMWLKENTELHTDTIMALLLSGSVSLGVIILSLLKGYRGEIQRYLFGDILAVSPADVWRSAALCLGVGAVVLWNLSPLTLFTANEELAHVCGVPVRRFNYFFVLVLALTVAASIRLLGILLVTSLLVIPAATARNLSHNLRQQILVSLGCGLAGALIGTLLSFQFDVPCGPAIVLTCIGLFLLSLPVGAALRKNRSSA